MVKAEKADAVEPDWSLDDFKILIGRIPMGYVSPVGPRVSYLLPKYKQLDWKKIKFGDFTAKECERKFLKSRELVHKRMPMEWDLDLLKKVADSHPELLQPVKGTTGPRNGFQIFYRDNIAKIREKHPGAKGGMELMPLARKKWRKLSSEQRKVYDDQAADCRKELKHQKEVDADPFKDIPPLPQSAFDLYMEANRDDFVDENLSEKKLRKKLSKRYAKLDEAEKKPWQKAAKKGAKQFLVELKAFKVANPKLAIVVPKIGDLIDGTAGPVAVAPPKLLAQFYIFCCQRLWTERDQTVDLGGLSWMKWASEVYKHLSEDQVNAYKEEYRQFVENHNQQVSAYLDAIDDEEFKLSEQTRLQPKGVGGKPKKRRLLNGDVNRSLLTKSPNDRSITEFLTPKVKKRKVEVDD